MAASTPLTGHRVILPPETCTPRPCLPSIEAKRSCQAERSREESFPGYGNLTRMHAEEGQAKRSGQDERSREEGVRGDSPDNDTTQHAYAQKKGKLSGQAERSGKGASGVSRLRQSKSHARRRKPSRAQGPGRSQRRRRGLEGTWKAPQKLEFELGL
jgi:hypothetical protein